MRRAGWASAGAIVAAVAVAWFAAATGHAQSVVIGSGYGLAGETVNVSVTVNGATSVTAALLRLEFDPATLEIPMAIPGPLLTPQHSIDAHSPAPGRINIAIYASGVAAGAGDGGGGGAPALAAASGVMCLLSLTIRPDAAPGFYPIVPTAETGATPFPSQLISTAGEIIPHGMETGGVLVGAVSRSAGSWVLYR